MSTDSHRSTPAELIPADLTTASATARSAEAGSHPHPHPGQASRTVVVACDKFKGSLTTAQVTGVLTRGLTAGRPNVRVVAVPVADGGDGTLDAACAAGFERVPVRVGGPTGEPVDTAYAIRDGVAVVEMADACGLLRLPGGVRHPMTASSRGLGEVVREAVDSGARQVVLGVGGSASTDGGAGLLAALGARLLDAEGRPLPDGGAALAELARLELGGLHPRLRAVELVLATDVTNPLLGATGAAAVFARQKGASMGQIRELEAALAHFATVVTAATGRNGRQLPGAGAAGGVGYAALTVLGARMRPGVEVVLEWSDFPRAVVGADLVVTGEGSLDRQTLLGKTPAGVARAAGVAGVPVVAVCGRSLLTAAQLDGTGIARVYALTDLEPDTRVCIRDAAPLLERLAGRVAADWLG